MFNHNKENHTIMKSIKKILGIGFLLLAFLNSGQVDAQKRSNSGNRNVKTERTRSNDHGTDRIGANHHGHNNRYRTQPIRRSPHYRYPHHRRVVITLPRHHVRLVYGGLPYFYYSGIYYTQYGSEYIVVMPPRGFRITVLPIGHVRIVVGPSVYFYHSGVYYTETTTTSTTNEGKYEVTQPPVGVILNDIDKDAVEVVIDGNLLYEYNSVLYKMKTDLEGNTTYEVVYSKSSND